MQSVLSSLALLIYAACWLIFTGYPLCGNPTVRSDIPVPRIRRLSDTTNYGDQGSVFAILFPSVFSQKGVYEQDLFKKRPKAEV